MTIPPVRKLKLKHTHYLNINYSLRVAIKIRTQKCVIQLEDIILLILSAVKTITKILLKFKIVLHSNNNIAFGFKRSILLIIHRSEQMQNNTCTITLY